MKSCPDTHRGETREDAVRLAAQLEAEGVVPLLGYSKESSDSLTEIQNTEAEIVLCIEAEKSLKKPTFVAIKLSGLSPEQELRQLERDIQELVSVNSASVDQAAFLSKTRALLLTRYPDFFNRLKHMTETAEKCNVQLVLDAEIRFHGEVDSLPASAVLCWLLNSGKNCMWNTHQM